MSGRYAAPPPRTKKHKTHLRKVKHMRMFIPPSDAGLPTSSWWTTADPRCFTATAQTEAPRMALSRFGRTQLPGQEQV